MLDFMFYFLPDSGAQRGLDCVWEMLLRVVWRERLGVGALEATEEERLWTPRLPEETGAQKGGDGSGQPYGHDRRRGPPMADLLDPASAAYKKARRYFNNATKHRQSGYDTNWSPFRTVEKRYKTRFPPPDLAAALDLATLDPHRTHEITQGLWRGSPDALHFHPIKAKNAVGNGAYVIPRIPGAVLDPGP